MNLYTNNPFTFSKKSESGPIAQRDENQGLGPEALLEEEGSVNFNEVLKSEVALDKGEVKLKNSGSKSGFEKIFMGSEEKLNIEKQENQKQVKEKNKNKYTDSELEALQKNKNRITIFPSKDKIISKAKRQEEIYIKNLEKSKNEEILEGEASDLHKALGEKSKRVVAEKEKSIGLDKISQETEFELEGQSLKKEILASEYLKNKQKVSKSPLGQAGNYQGKSQASLGGQPGLERGFGQNKTNKNISQYGRSSKILQKGLFSKPIYSAFSKPDSYSETSEAGLLAPSMTQDMQLGESQKLAQFLMNQENQASLNSPGISTKVLDLTHMGQLDSSEVIQKITDYVNISRFENEGQLDLTVRHDELGEFNISVIKQGKADQIEMKILTNNLEAQNFFIKNETELIQNLAKQGIRVHDFKALQVEGSKSGLSSFEGTMDSNTGANQSFSSEAYALGSRTQGEAESESRSQRRNEMWNYYKERYQA